jgi:uncharacterized protein (TIGR02147 family)
MGSLFAVTEYRKFLRAWIDSPEQGRGVLTRMAQALGCQNSHLSRLIREEVHLTPDQAFDACHFMSLSEPETRYFLKLVEYERAANPRYRARLKDELEALRREQEDLSKRYRQETVGQAESQMTYYSSWFWSALHVLADIPAYRTARAMAARLGMDETHVRHCLETLARFGLVERARGDTWMTSPESIHLPKNSPMISVHHGNWRSRAVADSQNPANNGLHYTIVQAVSEEDYARIKQLFLTTLDKYREIADASPSKDLVCLTCDFFKV